VVIRQLFRHKPFNLRKNLNNKSSRLIARGRSSSFGFFSNFTIQLTNFSSSSSSESKMTMTSGELADIEYTDEVARDRDDSEGYRGFLSLSELKSAVSDIREGGLLLIIEI
jgi:hypothetical protein